jgi:uncharacterized protein
MDFAVSGFEWDHGNDDKCQRHGVSIAAIESVFRGTVAVFPDPTHSESEERFKAIGRTGDGRTFWSCLPSASEETVRVSGR